jgi:predicted nuclease with TOPRIM domain
MPTQKKIYFFIVLLLLSTVPCSMGTLPDTTVTFSGAGVTIDLSYPEEAHPKDSITHNVTITAHTDLALQSFTLFIYAPVNSTLQEVKNRTISWDFVENENLTSRIEFQLPQNTNGTLYCEMTAQTDKTVYVLSSKFYTTHVTELTFSEMQSLYDEMLANYTALQEDYSTLLNTYNDLLVNYNSLLDNYTALVGEYDSLSHKYDIQVASYQTLLDEYSNLLIDKKTLDDAYSSKSSELSDLQAKYAELNATLYDLQGNFTKLQGNFTSLKTDYDALEKTYEDLSERNTRSESALDVNRIVMFIFVVAVAALIVFIVYLKRKKQEPYVVIRKETVSMKSEEES